MDFSFSTSKAIHFGNGVSRSCAALLPEAVKRVAVITGSDPDRHKQIHNSITSRNIEVQAFETKREPTVETIMETVKGALLFQPDCVVAVGGGSVIDTGKAVAALLANEGALTDYLEVVGKGKPLTHPSVPYMAIPTTAGTGSEVTRNSVIGIPEEGLKVSLRSSSMIPDWAIVDPELTYDLPRSIAAFTGMDAFIQCFEAYLSGAANPITDGIALEGVRRAAKALRGACGESLNKAAKSDMCIASLCGGMALANAKLGAVHGFAGPIGGMIDAPHGALCASLLLPVARMNFDIATRRDPSGITVQKFNALAVALTGNPSATGSYAIAWIESLIKELPLPSLKELGFNRSQISEAANKSAQSSSMKGNPIELVPADLREILDEALVSN